MRRIAVSQRVDIYPERNERRDALDQRWAKLLTACDCLAIPIPNDPANATAFWMAGLFDGLLLTGGNDLASLGGDAPERDATERILLDQARMANLPVLGVCRGMQLLLSLSGTQLVTTEGHIARRHAVFGNGLRREVNSFHRWAATRCDEQWEALAVADDGTIEAIKAHNKPIAGCMWHPERESPFDAGDLHWIKQLFFDAKLESDLGMKR